MTGFRYRLRVRYGECDAQKVVFNARYAEYVDLAVTEFFRALGFGAELVSGALDYQLVRQLIEWKAPARFDEVLDIAVRAGKIGTTSFTLLCEFRRAGEDRLLVTAETVYVLVDTHTLVKTPVSDALRRKMEAGVNQIVSHAG